MTTRLSRLIELNKRTDRLVELSRYSDDDGDENMLRDGAAAVGVLGTAGLGGLLLRNHGDKINEEKYAGIAKSAPLAAGQLGPVIPTAEQFAGGTGRAIGTGAKDLWKSIRSKLSIPALARNIKASARLERLVELNGKIDKLVNFDIEDGVIGAGLVGGGAYGGYALHQRGAGIPLSKREKKMRMGSFGPEVTGRGATSNIRVGASDLLKSLGKKFDTGVATALLGTAKRIR